MLHKYMVENNLYDEYCQFMKTIGADSLITSSKLIWVRHANAKDGVNLALAIESFIKNSKNGILVSEEFVDKNKLQKNDKEYITYGDILYRIMINGKYDYLEDNTGIPSLSKTGFVSGSDSLSCRNIISICYKDHPYAICLLTKKMVRVIAK